MSVKATRERAGAATAGKDATPDEVVSDEFSDHFWTGIAEGELRLQRCRACRRWVFYPRALCPHCHSGDLEWTISPGRGTVYSHTVVHRASGPYAPAAPYPVVLVDLDERVRILAQLDGVPPADVRIGMRVRVVFTEVNERAVFRFAPTPDGETS